MRSINVIKPLTEAVFNDDNGAKMHVVWNVESNTATDVSYTPAYDALTDDNRDFFTWVLVTATNIGALPDSDIIEGQTADKDAELDALLAALEEDLDHDMSLDVDDMDDGGDPSFLDEEMETSK